MSGPGAKLLGLTLNVRDLVRAQDFFCRALGFEPVDNSRGGRAWTDAVAPAGVRTLGLRLGAQSILLIERRDGLPYPDGSTAADLWFQHFAIVANDMPAAFARLANFDLCPITQGAPQVLPPSTGSVVAYKFRDPDGHPLELIAFPAGAGDPVWAQARGGPSIGVDHSAVSVAESARSVAFWSALGFTRETRGLNTGVEQDRLDGLAGVRVEVIGLAAPQMQTPHVELLCYRAPRGRAGPPRDETDIADTALVVTLDDTDDAVRRLERLDGVAQARCASDEARLVSIRDPDGHRVLLLDGA